MTLVQSVKEKTGESTKIFLCNSFLATKKEINLRSCSLALGCGRLLVLENFLYSVSHRNNKKEQKHLFRRFAEPQVEMRNMVRITPQLANGYIS